MGCGVGLWVVGVEGMVGWWVVWLSWRLRGWVVGLVGGEGPADITWHEAVGGEVGRDQQPTTQQELAAGFPAGCPSAPAAGCMPAPALPPPPKMHRMNTQQLTTTNSKQPNKSQESDRNHCAPVGKPRASVAGRVTRPPAWSMRVISESLLGVWSRVSWVAM